MCAYIYGSMTLNCKCNEAFDLQFCHFTFFFFSEFLTVAAYRFIFVGGDFSLADCEGNAFFIIIFAIYCAPFSL
jgi:hypothetical protein